MLQQWTLSLNGLWKRFEWKFQSENGSSESYWLPFTDLEEIIWVTGRIPPKVLIFPCWLTYYIPATFTIPIPLIIAATACTALEVSCFNASSLPLIPCSTFLRDVACWKAGCRQAFRPQGAQERIGGWDPSQSWELTHWVWQRGREAASCILDNARHRITTDPTSVYTLVSQCAWHHCVLLAPRLMVLNSVST